MRRDVDVATGTALWSAHGKTLPVRWVLTRDPVGRAETRAFVCSDPQQSAAQILTWYAMRWAAEVTFQESRRHLGFETQRQWSDQAIHRTTPLLLGLFSLVTLWAAELAATTGRENNLWMSASANNHAVVSDNHVGDNNVTGNVNVTDSAFQNVSGISMVNFNTGNNSSINAAMSVNLHINYAAPAAP